MTTTSMISVATSTGSETQTKINNAASGTLLQSAGTSSNFGWTTSTYPVTNAANTLLYASSANTMAALATGNNGVLITSGGGVPSISSTLPSAVQGNITSLGTLASLVTAPAASASSSLTVGTAFQNNLGYDAFLIVYLAVSAATSASILVGVGSTSTPTQQTVISGLTLAALGIIPIPVYFPSSYYVKISTSGTITQTISGQQIIPV